MGCLRHLMKARQEIVVQLRNTARSYINAPAAARTATVQKHELSISEHHREV